MHDEHGHDKQLGDRISIYQTLDELWRGRVKPEDMPPLEVVLCDGKLWSINNRRLADLKMFQAVSQHETVWVSCVLRPPNHPKFRSSKTTKTDGLSVGLHCMGQNPRKNSPFHMGAPAFNQAAQTMHGMQRFANKHAEVDCWLRRVKLAASKRRRGEDAITLRSYSVASTSVLESSSQTVGPKIKDLVSGEARTTPL